MCTADKCFYFYNAGDYYSAPPGVLDQEPDEDWVRSRQNEGRAYQEWDEDADVDESGEVLSAANNIRYIVTKKSINRFMFKKYKIESS